jgi:hypothetical protein
MKRKPTRRDLLVVIGRLQHLVGLADALNHDRNPNRHAEVHGTLEEALKLCIEVRSQDPPIDHHSGPWGEPKGEEKKRYV